MPFVTGFYCDNFITGFFITCFITLFECNHVIKTSQDSTKLSVTTVKNCHVFVTAFVITCHVTVFECNHVIKMSHVLSHHFSTFMTVTLLQAWLGMFLCCRLCRLLRILSSGTDADIKHLLQLQAAGPGPSHGKGLPVAMFPIGAANHKATIVELVSWIRFFALFQMELDKMTVNDSRMRQHQSTPLHHAAQMHFVDFFAQD